MVNTSIGYMRGMRGDFDRETDGKNFKIFQFTKIKCPFGVNSKVFIRCTIIAFGFQNDLEITLSITQQKMSSCKKD